MMKNRYYTRITCIALLFYCSTLSCSCGHRHHHHDDSGTLSHEMKHDKLFSHSAMNMQRPPSAEQAGIQQKYSPIYRRTKKIYE